MISKLNLKKNLKKIKDIYYIELEIPNLLNDINYKIYGSNGFIHYGILNSYSSLNYNNIIVIPVDKIQNICITIKLNSDKKNIEYFDFFDMNNLVNISNKNIKIDVTRIKKNYDFSSGSKYSIMNLKKNEEDDDEDDEDDEEDDDEEDDDDEDDEDTKNQDKKNEDSDEDTESNDEEKNKKDI
jgi:hypothetical protein